MKHKPEVVERAMELFFAIEQRILTGGSPPSIREINKMLGLSSSASAQYYIKILEQWGLIKRLPNTTRTIQLTKTNYPPVVYRPIK